MAQVLESWLAVQSDLPRDVHHVLVLLYELVTGLGICISDRVKQALNSKCKGSSKTAKYACNLLSHLASQSTAAGSKASLQTLESRIERAERWYQKATTTSNNSI